MAPCAWSASATLMQLCGLLVSTILHQIISYKQICVLAFATVSLFLRDTANILYSGQHRLNESGLRNAQAQHEMFQNSKRTHRCTSCTQAASGN